MTDDVGIDEVEVGRQLVTWLGQDDEGRRILRALADDPAAAELALRKRVQQQDAPQQVATLVSGGAIGKLATIARAEKVLIGDRFYNRLKVNLDPYDLIRRSRGLPRLLMLVGLALALAGFAAFMLGIFSASDAPGFPALCVFGFTLMFTGAVPLAIGSVMVAKKAPRPSPGVSALITVSIVATALATAGIVAKATAGTGANAVRVILSRTSGPAGSALTVSGTGFDPGASVQIFYGGQPLSQLDTDGNGAFSGAPVRIPKEASGAEAIRVQELNSVRGSEQLFQVVPTATSRDPGTGEANAGQVSQPAPPPPLAQPATPPPPAQAWAAPPAPPPQAQAPPPATEPTLQLSRASGPPGTSLSVSGAGFEPSETVVITFHTQEVGRFPASANGGFSGRVITIPADWQFRGQFPITASGVRSARWTDQPFTVT